MSEERLTRIETTLDGLVHGQAELRADVTQLKTQVAKLEVGQAKLEVGQAGLDVGLADLRQGQIALRDDLYRHMGTLHEETLDAIRAATIDPAAISREIHVGLADLRETFDRRLEPIEAAIRQRNA